MIVGMVDEMSQEAEGQRKESTSINKKSRGQQGLIHYRTSTLKL